MKNIFSLYDANNNESFLWTRETGVEIRKKLIAFLEKSNKFDVVFVDFEKINAFDFSFANELFGKLFLRLPIDFPENYIAICNLSEYTRENLTNAISNLPIVIIEQVNESKLELLGNVHTVDILTFEKICQSSKPITANELANQMNVKIQTMNERLSKLVDLRVIKRSKSLSQAGREQFEYMKPF